MALGSCGDSNLRKESLREKTDGTGEPSFPVVGIGASAGGLEAVTELLSGLKTTTGMAFLLVQHLESRREGSLDLCRNLHIDEPVAFSQSTRCR